MKENRTKCNHLDGQPSTTTGIGLPKWITHKNIIWALGACELVFGVALPALVVCLRNEL